MSTGRVVAAVVALALGGFAIGTTEFVTMGLLPDMADGVGIDIPTAGGHRAVGLEGGAHLDVLTTDVGDDVTC